MKRLLVILALAVVVATGCRPLEPWAVMVNGREISSETVEAEIDAVLANPDYAKKINEDFGGTGDTDALQRGGPNTINADYTGQIISGRIIAALVQEELGRQKLVVTDEARGRAEQLFSAQYPDVFDDLDSGYRSYLIDRVGGLLVLLDNEASPEKVQAYYDQHKVELATNCLRHIVVASTEQADAIRARLTGGEDFGTVARSESLDTGSRQQGGEMGCAAPADLDTIPVFSEAVRTLPVNEISRPVRSDFGIHVIQVTSRTQLSVQEAQPYIAQKIADPTAYIGKLIERAKIEINPRFGEYTPADAASGAGAVIQPHQSVGLRDSADEPDQDFGRLGNSPVSSE